MKKILDNKEIFADIDDDQVIQAQPNVDLKGYAIKSFDLSEAEHGLAVAMGLSLDGDASQLITAAANKTNQALVLVIESGLLLIAANTQCESERSDSMKIQFKDYLESVGMPKQRAYEAMSMARYAASLPEDQRAEVMALPKTKVALLAQADPEVIADLFEDEEVDIQSLSVRELKTQIRTLKAEKAQSSVNVKKAEAEKDNLQKKLDAAIKSRADTTDIVPPHVSDIRLEVAELYKKAELSIDGIGRQINETHLLDGEWALSTARSSFAALQSLIAQAKGAASELHRTYGADLDGDTMTLERLTQKELFQCAINYRELVGEHEHESALRAHERSLDKPKGKGRPKAAPTKDKE